MCASWHLDKDALAITDVIPQTRFVFGTGSYVCAGTILPLNQVTRRITPVVRYISIGDDMEYRRPLEPYTV